MNLCENITNIVRKYYNKLKQVFTTQWHLVVALTIVTASVCWVLAYWPWTDKPSEESSYAATVFSGFGVILFGVLTFIMDIIKAKDRKLEIAKSDSNRKEEMDKKDEENRRLKRGFELSIIHINLIIKIYEFDADFNFKILQQPTISISVTLDVTSYVNNQINLQLLPLGNGTLQEIIVPKTIHIKPLADKERLRVSYETGYNPLTDERSSKNFDGIIKATWRTLSSYGADRNIEPTEIKISHNDECLLMLDGNNGIKKFSGFTGVGREFLSVVELQKYYEHWSNFSTTSISPTLSGNINVNLLKLYDDFVSKMTKI
jgi:hypothetical protein